jgi:hypothetical protein
MPTPNRIARLRQAASGCNIDHVRLKLLGAFLIVVLPVVAVDATSEAQSRPDSGVRGLVLYGPTCPVQRPGHICVKPYAAWITIRREPKGTVAARVHAGSDGRFTARLRAGHYLLVPRNGNPFPRAQSQAVSVHRHRFATVTIHFESGIR